MPSDRESITLSWETDEGKIRWMIFDCVELVNHSSSTTVTESPIEDGSSVADHAFNDPDVVTLNGVVSNTPLPSNPAVGSANDLLARSALMSPTDINFSLPDPAPRPNLSGALSAAGGLLGRAGGQRTAAGVWRSQNYLDRVREAFDILREVKRTFRRVTVQTELHSYEDMLIRTLVVPETVEEGTSRTFQIAFRELFTGTTSDVRAPVPAEIKGQPLKTKSKSLKDSKNQDEEKEKASKSSLAVKSLKKLGLLS